jgi:hypothetical protein
MVNVFERQLGKRAPRIDKRTLQLKDYLKLPEEEVSITRGKTDSGIEIIGMAVGLPPLFPAQSWLTKVPSWPMYGNDVVGDCVLAYVGHQIQIWESWNSPNVAPPTKAQIEGAYSAITGWVPGDPSTDNGAVIIDVLNYWRKTGIAGRKILAYAQITPGDVRMIRESVKLFGGTCLGVALPASAQTQTIWTRPKLITGEGAPGSWGGHCVPAGAYNWLYHNSFNPNWPWIHETVITWGAEMLVGDGFLYAYNDEAYAVFSEEWLDAKGTDPEGFDRAALLADLKDVTA